MEYNYSYVAILDGRDGSQLWTLNSTHTGLMSSLSLQAHAHGEDAVVFFAIGRQPEPRPQANTNLNGLLDGLNALRPDPNTGPKGSRGGDPQVELTEGGRRESESDLHLTDHEVGGRSTDSLEFCRSFFEGSSLGAGQSPDWRSNPGKDHVRGRRHGGGGGDEELEVDGEDVGELFAGNFMINT